MVPAAAPESPKYGKALDRHLPGTQMAQEHPARLVHQQVPAEEKKRWAELVLLRTRELQLEGPGAVSRVDRTNAFLHVPVAVRACPRVGSTLPRGTRHLSGWAWYPGLTQI